MLGDTRHPALERCPRHNSQYKTGDLLPTLVSRLALLSRSVPGSLDLTELFHGVLCVCRKAAYLCMARCFDNPKASLDTVQACTQRCEQHLQVVNHVLQKEMNEFQAREAAVTPRWRLTSSHTGVVFLACCATIGRPRP